jgi:hypothetical protein
MSLRMLHNRSGYRQQMEFYSIFCTLSDGGAKQKHVQRGYWPNIVRRLAFAAVDSAMTPLPIAGDLSGRKETGPLEESDPYPRRILARSRTLAVESM